MDMFGGRLQASGTPASKVVELGGIQSPFIGVAGSEGLGAGLRAEFALEAYIQPDIGAAGRFAGDGFFTRGAFVGLVSETLGSFKAGRLNNALYLPTILTNPFVASFKFSPQQLHAFSAAYGRTIAGDTTWANALEYSSPAWKGWSLNLTANTSEVANQRRNVGGFVMYRIGSALATFGTSNSENGAGIAPGTGQRTHFVGGTYDFSVAKLWGSYHQSKIDLIATRTKTSQLGISVPAGNGRILASVATTSREASLLPSVRRTTGAAGYVYSLSKRTELYGMYMLDEIEDTPTGNSYGAGIRHRF